MISTFLQHLSELLTHERIEYADLKALISDLTQLNDADLDTLITRFDAIHRLLLACHAKRQQEISASATATDVEVH